MRWLRAGGGDPGAFPGALPVTLPLTLPITLPIPRPTPLLWAALAGVLAGACGPSGSSDPEATRVHVEDVARFWAVADPFLEAVAAGSVPPELVRETTRRLDQEYLGVGTPILRRFVSQQGITARGLMAAMSADPFRYRAVRDASMALVADRAGVEARVHALNRRLVELYPDAAFRDLYFVVGTARSGGTAFRGGTVVASEMAGTLDDYMNLVAHELAHAQQPSRSNASVLRHGLREGAADWVAEQLTGQPVRSRAFAWGYAHEAQVWADFRRHAGGTLFDRWFGDARSPVVPGRLGYFMGYRIISEYAAAQRARGASEAQVMTEVLRFGQPDRLFRESGYRPGPISRIRAGALRAMGWRVEGAGGEGTGVEGRGGRGTGSDGAGSDGAIAHGTGAELPTLGIVARARVEAPDGSTFRNEVVSSADGSGRLHQSDGHRAAVGRRFTWAVSPDGADAVDDLTRGFVRGHELHALALFPETRLFEPVYLGEVALGAVAAPHLPASEALAVRWKVNATDSLVLYYDRADTLPAGVDILWTEPAVRVRFTDWAPVGDRDTDPGARLFRGATFRRGDQLFRYTWDQIELGPADAREFERPRSRPHPPR